MFHYFGKVWGKREKGHNLGMCGGAFLIRQLWVSEIGKVLGGEFVSRQAVEEKQYWKVLGGVYVSLQFFDIKTRLGRCGERFSFLFRFYWEDDYWVFLGKS